MSKIICGKCGEPIETIYREATYLEEAEVGDDGRITITGDPEEAIDSEVKYTHADGSCFADVEGELNFTEKEEEEDGES